MSFAGIASVAQAGADLALVRSLRAAMNGGAVPSSVAGTGVPGPLPIPQPTGINAAVRHREVEPQPRIEPRKRIEPEPRIEPRLRYEPTAIHSYDVRPAQAPVEPEKQTRIDGTGLPPVWKMPIEDPPAPRPGPEPIKLVVRRPDMQAKGTLLDLFV